MKRILILCCLIISLVAYCLGQATSSRYLALSVKLVDGTQHTFVVSDDLTISFKDTDICIDASDHSSSYTICDVDDMRYVYLSAIDDVANDYMMFDGNSLMIAMLGITHVDVYSLDGRLLRTASIDGSGCVSLEGLSGFVLVNIGSKTLKLRI